MSLTLRPATLGDIDAVYKLWNDPDATFWSGQTVSPEVWAQEYPKLLAAPSWVILVAEKDGQVVGYQAQEIVVFSLGRGMVVAPEHRNSGIGRLLLARMEGTLRAKGIPSMTAHIHAANQSSLNLFKRAGFALADKAKWPTVVKALTPAAPKGTST